MLHPIQIKYEISFHRIRYHLEHVSKYSRHFYMLSTKNIFGQSSIHLTILEIGLCSLNSIHLLTLNHKIFSYFSWLLWFVEKLCNQIPPHMLLIGMDEIYWKTEMISRCVDEMWLLFYWLFPRGCDVTKLQIANDSHQTFLHKIIWGLKTKDISFH